MKSLKILNIVQIVLLFALIFVGVTSCIAFYRDHGWTVDVVTVIEDVETRREAFLAEQILTVGLMTFLAFVAILNLRRLLYHTDT